jgi:hypothetical protein
MPSNPFRDHLATVLTEEDFVRVFRDRERSRSSRVPAWLYDYEDEEIEKGREICEARRRTPCMSTRSLQQERDDLRRIWTAVGSELSRSRVLKKRLTWVTTALGVIGAGAGILLPQLPGLVASVFTTAATLSVFDLEAVYARLFRPDHLVAVVALRDYLNDHPSLTCP